MNSSMDTLKEIICEAITTQWDEISCAECFEQLDQFTDMMLLNEHAVDVMPRVRDHLQRCPDCRQEYDALLCALRAMASSTGQSLGDG